MTRRVLVVDDKLALAETLADGLADRGYDATAVGTGKEALAQIQAGGVDVLVTDLRMPDLDGLALLDAARAVAPELPTIVMTAYGAIDSAVESIRRGAYHYLTKPFKLEELLVFVERALGERALRRTLRERFSIGGLVAHDPAMQKVIAIIERIAKSDVPVLITGETGAGKGAVARAIHGESGRSGAFVAINCAALPEHLLESELFGHLRGAFTGATADRSGLFAEADGGTVLLDEIAEMSPALQAKLLHVIETRQVRPLGAAKDRPIDVRVLAATHRDLRQRIAEGTFREDLLYRLDVVSIDIPPLRARREDIPVLVDHFLLHAKQRHAGSRVTGFSRDALARLLDYHWPGNVRELAHVIERSVLLAEGTEIAASELPPHVRATPTTGDGATFSGPVIPIRELQRRYARWALDELDGHKARTAAELGVDAKTLNKWLADDD
ncbi:MAG: sigma-54-dependent transcriptional regulator [Acidobacteriota bacterium]